MTEAEKLHLKMINLMGDKIKILKDLLEQAQDCISDNLDSKVEQKLWYKIEQELNQNKDN